VNDDFKKGVMTAIRQLKEEVYNMKVDNLNQSMGRVIRDDKRIVLSAPEIIIGDVNLGGILNPEGYSKVTIRGYDVSLQGAGDMGQVDMRAPIISQVAENPGCEEFIDGFFKYYKELGVDFIRMDFLSWYEDGKDRYAGIQGRGYGRESYARALAYIAASAKKYGVFTSLVMPHMYDDAVVEAKYGNMVRIVADTGTGTWWHCSAQDKGKSYTTWPNCMNQFDGFKYWSHIAGRDKVILDGDFLRLNTFDNDNERQTVVSLQLLAGGPVAVADQPSSIGDNLKFYTNSELLALNADGFVGKPLSDKLGDNNEVWYGQMKNGDWVVGLFNRDENTATMTVDFSQLGISGEMNVRDLWKHVDEGKASSLTANVPAHGCKIVKLTK
jgi:hypothetical protein